MNQKFTADQKAAIIKEHQEGKTPTEIHKDHGVKPNTLWHWENPKNSNGSKSTSTDELISEMTAIDMRKEDIKKELRARWNEMKKLEKVLQEVDG